MISSISDLWFLKQCSVINFGWIFNSISFLNVKLQDNPKMYSWNISLDRVSFYFVLFLFYQFFFVLSVIVLHWWNYKFKNLFTIFLWFFCWTYNKKIKIKKLEIRYQKFTVHSPSLLIFSFPNIFKKTLYQNFFLFNYYCDRTCSILSYLLQYIK